MVARATAGLGALAAGLAGRPEDHLGGGLLKHEGLVEHAGERDDGAAGVERLAVRAGMPLLAARYRVTGRLGEGTFAQLVAATDEYRARPGVDVAVAIKIMHTPYGLIGERVRSGVGGWGVGLDGGGAGCGWVGGWAGGEPCVLPSPSSALRVFGWLTHRRCATCVGARRRRRCCGR